jgi:hypothetical protein
LRAAFAPLPAGFGLDTLLAVKYMRKTGSCGCFPFQNQVVIQKV